MWIIIHVEINNKTFNLSHIITFRFQHDSEPLPSSKLTVEQMESKLVDYFHGDFLKMISFLK